MLLIIDDLLLAETILDSHSRTLIKPVITYRWETWCPNKQDEIKLAGFWKNLENTRNDYLIIASCENKVRRFRKNEEILEDHESDECRIFGPVKESNELRIKYILEIENSYNQANINKISKSLND